MNSDILILVVGILTYSEQKLLNKIKNEIKKLKINKPLYIIHNLKTFCTKKQVESYIKETLMKSATFTLKEGHKITTQIKDGNGSYFFEIKNDPKIYHLIFANEGSEAGDFYNNFTINFIEQSYQGVTDLKKFDVIETIKNRFVELSTEIIEKYNDNQELFKLEDLMDNKDIIEKRIIKLKKKQEIILKRCLIDELGFSNLRGNGFEPNFNYYQKDQKIIVRVEAPGNCSIQSKINYSGEYTIIRLKGTKKQDKEPKKGGNIHTTREFGDFNLDIPLKTEEYKIKNQKPTINEKKGVLILEYEIEKKEDNYEFKTDEKD